MCVVAGWAVDDVAATKFATTFYDALLGGSRFIDAVAAARAAAYEFSPQTNTWAAFQCYGNADWVLRRPLLAEFVSLPSRPEPTVELCFRRGTESLPRTAHRPDSVSGGRSRAATRPAAIPRKPIWSAVVQSRRRGRTVRQCVCRTGSSRLRHGERDERALSTSGGRPSFRAAEQLANLRCRAAVDILARIGNWISRRHRLLTLF